MTDTSSTITAPDAPISVRPVYSASMVTAAGDTLGVITLAPKHIQIVIVRPDTSAWTLDLTDSEAAFISSLIYRADVATGLPQAKRA